MSTSDPAGELLTVRTRQGRVSTAVERVGEGEPLLYLHGPFGCVERPFVRALAAQRTVYVPAHPGFEGMEGLDAIDANVFDLVLHYDELIEALALPVPVDVAGHSFGASIAAELAAIFPHRVRRLALLAPIGVWCDDRPQPDLFGLTPGALGRAVFDDPTSPEARAMLTAPADREEARAWNRIRRRNLIGVVKFLWPLPDWGFRQRAHRLRAPTLLAWGAHDQVVPPDAYLAAYRTLIPHAEATLIDGAGHMLPLEQPRPAARAVLTHLGSP